MEPLSIIITDAGTVAIVDAEGGGFDAITIAEIGLTNTAFVAAPSLTALPGEFKRINTISGIAADDSTLHILMRDGSADTFEFSGFGIYLDDGTLFAVYGQEDAIAGKATVSSLLLAIDIKLEAGQAALFAFGDTNFIDPPATADIAGVARLATLPEVAAGTGADTIVTPEALAAAYVALAALGVAEGVATLDANGKLTVGQRPPIDLIDVWPVADQAAMLALAATEGDFAVRADNGLVYVLQQAPANVLANWLQINTPAPVMSVNGKVGIVVLTAADVGAPPTARTITGGGLATGGGSLAANRVITVTAASAAEVMAGEDATKAVTPASLADLLMSVAGKVPTARTITAAGLATGGGALDADRTITVPAASSAEVLAGVDATKAITPAALAGLPHSYAENGHEWLPGGRLRQWGGVSILPNRTLTITLPVAFLNECSAAGCFGGFFTTNAKDNYPAVVSASASSITFFNAQEYTVSLRWWAEGY